jgi:hypothetical protein
VNVVGTVVFEPDANTSCYPVEITLTFSFTRNLTEGSVFTIYAPGMTSGACYNATDGYSIDSVTVPNTERFAISYTEGTYLDSYASSKFGFVFTGDELDSSKTYTTVIDRANNIRRSCSINTTWEVVVFPVGKTSGVVGAIDVIESLPKRCFVYDSSMYFSNPMQQFFTGINFTLQLGYEIVPSTVITLHLPGFSNKVGAYPLNEMTEERKYIKEKYPALGNGADAALYDVTSNTNFSFSAYWYEGSYINQFASSRIEITALGLQTYNDLMWINIPKSLNHIVPICGMRENSPDLKISTASTYFYTESVSPSSSNAIGLGCPNNCSYNGECDYCTSSCTCKEGYGSVGELNRFKNGDFAIDCSAKVCPMGPSMGTLLRHDVYELDRADDTQLFMHREVECSNAGLCNRYGERDYTNPKNV